MTKKKVRGSRSTVCFGRMAGSLWGKTKGLEAKKKLRDEKRATTRCGLVRRKLGGRGSWE